MPRRRSSAAALNPVQVLQEQINRLQKTVETITQPGVSAIHAIDKDFYLTPVQGEMEWHYPWYRGYVRHEDKWMPIMPPTLHIKVKADDRPVETGDGKFKFALSRDMDGLYLFDAEAYITTTGSCTVSLYNNTQTADLLSVPMTIDSGDKHTRYAATKRQINAVQCEWADEIWINVDAVGGDCMGLGILLVFAAKPSIVDLNIYDG